MKIKHGRVCPFCNSNLVEFPHVPSPLDNLECPKCHGKELSFLIPLSLGSCVVDCRCEFCGHKWSVRTALPKNFFGESLGEAKQSGAKQPP